MNSPLDPFTDYFEMCVASRTDDIPTHDEWAARLRESLRAYGLDTDDPTILAAVAAGVVETLGAVHEHGNAVNAALALGGALSDLSQPHRVSVAA